MRFLGGPIRTTLYGAAYVLRKKNYNYKIKTENAQDSKRGDYLGIGIAVMPFVDEKMMLFPEVFGDTPGMHLQEIKHSISRLSLLDRWEKAEDGGKHTEIEPKELMSNSKISSIEVKLYNMRYSSYSLILTISFFQRGHFIENLTKIGSSFLLGKTF